MFKHKDINEYLKEKEDSTILLDVRTKEEYEEIYEEDLENTIW